MKLLELFKGTGSIAKVFEREGWEVTSLDIDPKSEADITANILDWDYTEYEPGHFDAIWGSPPCTEYSKAKTRGTRNLQLADSIVLKLLEIIDYFKPRVWWFENPHSGLLPKRLIIAHLPPPYMVSYCMYGMPYRKHTALWTNVAFEPLACNKNCGSYINGRHIARAQGDQFKTKSLYITPERLCEAIFDATREHLLEHS